MGEEDVGRGVWWGIKIGIGMYDILKKREGRKLFEFVYWGWR